MKMISYCKLEGFPVVETALESVIRHGWDATDWRRGYTLLHYVCECTGDPSIAELICLLCTDLDAKDHQGFRAIDYARENPVKGMAKVVMKHRAERHKQQKEL